MIGKVLEGSSALFKGIRARLNFFVVPLAGVVPSGDLHTIGASAATAATGTLTSDTTNVSNGDTITVGGQTYTARTSLTASTTANEYLIGANADASLLNLIRAINLTGTPGTDYGSLTTRNALVWAAGAVTSHAFAVTAISPGAIGNLIGTTDTSAHLSWGSATLTGGAEAALNVNAAGAGSSSTTPVYTTPAAVTPNQVAVGASASGTIPAGAKGWTFTVLTGTATFGGVAVSAGFSDSDVNTLAVAISYTTGTTSSAYIRYNT